jgi:hypothetical protein
MKLTTMTQITVDGVMQGNGHATPAELASGFTRDGWATKTNCRIGSDVFVEVVKPSPEAARNKGVAL